MSLITIYEMKLRVFVCACACTHARVREREFLESIERPMLTHGTQVQKLSRCVNKAYTYVNNKR